MEEIINKIRNYFKQDEELSTYDNLDVQYILTDKDKKITDIICYGIDIVGNYNLDTNKYEHIMDWDYNVDTYLFEELEKGKNILYVSPEAHYDIWNTINDWYPEDINFKDGLNKYLEYCKDNGVTKEFIDKKIKLDVIDIFKVIAERDIKENKNRQLDNNIYPFELNFNINEKNKVRKNEKER